MVDLIKQGMLFYVTDQSSNENVLFKGEHTPTKRRIWLVVSNNKCNRHSPEISMCPIYTRDHVTQPTHVFYKNSEGRNQVVCCESVRCIPKHLIDARGYMGMVSEDIMQRVRKALAIQFGDGDPDIEPTATNIIEETVTDMFNTMDIKSVIAQKVCEVLFSGFTHSQVQNSVPVSKPTGYRTIEVEPVIPPTNIPTEEPSPVVADTEPDLPVMEEPVPEEDVSQVEETVSNTPIKKKKVHKPHGKSIPKDMLWEFYNDAGSMTLDELYDKWSVYGVIKDTVSVYKKRNAIKTRLKALGMWTE